MVREFLQINRRRLWFLVLFFAGGISVLLLACLAAAQMQVDKPLSDFITAILLFVPSVFLLLLLALMADGVRDFRRSRKVLAQDNWRAFFETLSLRDTVIDTGKFRFLQEAKCGQIREFHLIAYVDLKRKAMHFVVLGRDPGKGRAADDDECNCHLELTDWQQETRGIERAVHSFMEEIRQAGITPSRRTTCQVSPARP